MVTEATAWAVQADIPLPDPFTAAMAGGGVIGAVTRRRLRRAAQRKAAEGDPPSGETARGEMTGAAGRFSGHVG